jgi:hypothetical protein
MSSFFTAALNVEVNFALGVYDKASGRLLEMRRTHNVTTNVGRDWMVTLFGSSDYSQVKPTPLTDDKIMYMGLGVGGALQTDNQYANTQAELVTVVALEDPVPFSEVGNVKTYLRQVNNQSLTTTYFPGSFRTVFILDIAETEISYAAAKSRVSDVAVGTAVPISEAGLYLSSAVPTYDAVAILGVDPATSTNKIVAYNIFDPIMVTPNVVIRAEWELRVG